MPPSPKPEKQSYTALRKERADALKVDAAGRLAALLATPALTTKIAGCREELYHLLTAYQRDIVSPSNAAHVGEVVLAISGVMSFLDSVAAFGEDDMKRLPAKQQPENQTPQ